jgi:hypothetical protein
MVMVNAHRVQPVGNSDRFEPLEFEVIDHEAVRNTFVLTPIHHGGHLFCINSTNVDLPLVKQDNIDSALIAKNLSKDVVNGFGRKHTIDTLKFCYGHLLADYCYQLIMCYIKKRHSLSNIPKDIIHRLGLNIFFQRYFNCGDVYSYYEQLFKQRGLYCGFT